MNVIFLMIAYPDVRKNNNSLYTDLAGEFAGNGHNVYVVAPSLSEENMLLKEGAVNVLRIKTDNLFNANIFKKGIANLRLPGQFKKAVIKHLSDIRFDILITPTPPITLCSIAEWFKKKYNAKHYLILRDIFPQNAKDLGLIRSNIVFNFFRRKEKQLYHVADQIGCMSKGNIDYIKKHNPWIDDKKLHLLPNWETPDIYSEPSGQMKKRYRLEDKFVLVFGGNIGAPQQTEYILELAERKQNMNDVVFLVIGKGTERNRIESLAKGRKLKNVVFKDKIPRKEYNELIKECEIGLICLNEKFTIPNIPSKTLSYFNAKLPILASIDRSTDYGNILDEAKAGLWSYTGDIDAYEHNFDILYHDKSLRKTMGENGYDYLCNFLTSSKAYRTIIHRLMI